jgi:hypothetical protein
MRPAMREIKGLFACAAVRSDAQTPVIDRRL